MNNRWLALLLLLLCPALAFAQQPVNTEMPPAASPADGMANPVTPGVTSFGVVWSGSAWSRVTFGTAGTAATQVWSMQGIAGMTPVIGVGNKSNNNAAPGATNYGAMTFLANAAAPSWTEGNLVLGSVDLAGNLRVASHAVTGTGNFNAIGTKTNNAAAPGATNVGALGMLANAASPTFTEGNLVTGSVDLHGSTRMLIMDTAGAAAVFATDYVHDAALTAASTSGPAMICRSSTAAPASTSADDDAALVSCDRTGAVRVTGASGTTQYTEDAAATDGASMVAAGFIRRDTTPTSSAGAAGENAAGNVDANGRLYTNATLYSAAGAALLGQQTAAGSIPVTLSSDRNPCSDSAQVTDVVIETTADVQLVAISGSTVIYVCGYNFASAGTVNVRLINGTGTVCATGLTAETGTYQAVAQWGINVGFAGATVLKTDAGDALCLDVSAAISVSGLLSYVQR